jgi:hypothetical protein
MHVCITYTSEFACMFQYTSKFACMFQYTSEFACMFQYTSEYACIRSSTSQYTSNMTYIDKCAYMYVFSTRICMIK